jgi:Leucine-rich repeat (LRR) protein
MEGFLQLSNLKKLYLEKNLISKLDGLDNCRKLEELNLNDQMLAEGKTFSFDEYSLAAVSSTLRELHMQNCQIEQPKPLFYLERIEFLNLKDNLISDFDE